MRSDISILESEFTKEEMRFIKDYLIFVRDQLNNPTKPEIHIGAARYPLGRMVARRGVIPLAIESWSKHRDSRELPEVKERLTKSIESLKTIQTIVENLKQRGKTIKKRK